MDIAINGRFLSQRATGVQRVAKEFTRALDRLLGEGAFPTTGVRLIVQKDANPAALDLRNIGVVRAAGPTGHLWEQLVLPRHVGDATLLCLCNSAPAGRLLSGAPTGVMLHDQAYTLFPEDYSLGYRVAHRLIDRLLLAKAQPLFVVSDTERQTLAQVNPGMKARMIVAPNGSWIDDAASSTDAEPALPSSEGYGLYVGSFTSRKNVDAILATAIALAREREMPFRLVGPMNHQGRELQERIPRALRSLIQICGYVGDEALPDYYRGARYLLYPSFYEASGLPPSEAMTFGCPVVASDLPVLRERCGDAALYCAPDDHGALVSAVRSILDDPDLASDLSTRGHARAAGTTWRRQALIIMETLTASPASSNAPDPDIRPTQAPRRVAADRHQPAPM